MKNIKSDVFKYMVGAQVQDKYTTVQKCFTSYEISLVRNKKYNVYDVVSKVRINY